MYTTNSDGLELYYDVIGAGEPLVLLPGASLSHVLFVETGLAELFAEEFTVILMDFTGLGASGRVTQVKPSQWAQDVISVLDAAGVDRAHLAGSSLGARVAARVAADWPDRVDKLLVDMPITGINEQQEVQLDALFSNYATNHLAAGAERQHGPRWHEAMDLFVATRQDQIFREYYSVLGYLDRVDAPTLICRSDEDHQVHPLAMALEWHVASAHSALWIEPGASNPALVQACPHRVVRQFLDFVGGGAGAT